MSDEKPVESNSTPPNESTKPKKPAAVELSEEEMSKVSGGHSTGGGGVGVPTQSVSNKCSLSD